MATATLTRVGHDVAVPRESEGFDMPALAGKMWRPMLAMGVMAVLAGVVVGIGLLLSVVTFLLATILGALRDGGNGVQQALGAPSLILKRPLVGKVFPPVMMMGLMTLLAALIAGFVQAAQLDTDPAGAADIAAWVGPLRFAGVALLFTAVSLALATIVRVLRFQASRIDQIAAERSTT